MQQPTPNNKPFWSLIILLILVFALRVSFVVILLGIGSMAIPAVIWPSMITLVILAGEAVVYRKLRSDFHRMSWVWIHIILLYLILLFLPLLYSFGTSLLLYYFPPVTYGDWIEKFGMARVAFFWSGLGIAHFFFVLTIVYGFRKKKIAKPVQNEPAHLLDEFHE